MGLAALLLNGDPEQPGTDEIDRSSAAAEPGQDLTVAAPSVSTMPSLDAIGLVCDDLAATLAFYRTLGLDLPDVGEGHVETTTAGGLRVMFDAVEVVQSFSEWSPPTGGGRRVALAFLCDSPAEVDRIHDGLVADGSPSHVAPFDAPWGQRYATVIDPDGNPVDLFAALA